MTHLRDGSFRTSSIPRGFFLSYSFFVFCPLSSCARHAVLSLACASFFPGLTACALTHVAAVSLPFHGTQREADEPDVIARAARLGVEHQANRCNLIAAPATHGTASSVSKANALFLFYFIFLLPRRVGPWRFGREISLVPDPQCCSTNTGEVSRVNGILIGTGA